MGDSYVWGDGYSNFNDIWWRQLQRELLYRGYQVEVIAAGQKAASTHDQFGHLKKIVSSYDPDLIIWGYVTNDPDEGLVKLQLHESQLSYDPFYKAHAQLLKWNILPRLNFQLLSLRKNRLFQGFPYQEWELELLKGDNIARYAETLQKISAWSRESAIPYFFITLPYSPDADHYRPRYEAVVPLFKKAGIPFYNILDEFVAQYPRQKSPTGSELVWGINPSNGHPGPVGTRFYAQQTVSILERDYPWILSEKASQQQIKLRINQWRPWDLEVLEQSEHGITFSYPDDPSLMLRMPYGKPFVQFNFDYPVPLTEIKVSGPDLAEAALYYSGEDPSHLFESVRVVAAGQKRGNRLAWSLEAYEFKDWVNTVRISAQFSGDDRVMEVQFVAPKVGR
jgi:hypothetical protein